MEIKIQKASVLKEKPDFSKLGFGKYFTDHMFVMEYTEGEGWKNPRIVPFDYIPVHPASTVLHYEVGGQAVLGRQSLSAGSFILLMFSSGRNI